MTYMCTNIDKFQKLKTIFFVQSISSIRIYERVRVCVCFFSSTFNLMSNDDY